ncbi:MAG: hypothetical protein K2J08_10120 [Ruminococcus sp.]|nr:hypothetical protein [Ruminococcus sp.]MDE6500491.1 hypothetical protein [Ruminococcus sp.]
MQKEIIDVDYVEVDNAADGKKEPVDITVNADPFSALFSGIASVVNNVTNSVKEYNMCRQQEETKRAAIKAQLKAELAQINAQKEVFLQVLENKHEIDKMLINNEHQYTIKLLDSAVSAVDGAVEQAKKNNDFTAVIDLLKASCELIDMRSKINLQIMDKVYSSKPVDAIDCKSPKGYLE